MTPKPSRLDGYIRVSRVGARDVDTASYRPRTHSARKVATTEYTDRSYECAGWWQTVECETQEVALWSNGYIGYAFDGLVIGSDLSSRLGVVQYGSKRDENVGQAARHTV